MTTNFVYKGNSIMITVGRGELLEDFHTKLRQTFQIPPNKEILICRGPPAPGVIEGVLLKAPLDNSLHQVYCLAIPANQMDIQFRKIFVYDNSFDCPELEFLIHGDLTLKEVESMYRFTKNCKFRSISFVVKDSGEDLSMEIPLKYIPNHIQLTVMENLVRVLVEEDGKLIDKNKIQYTMFSKKNARQLLLRLKENLKEKLEFAKVFFRYCGVDIPEQDVFSPEHKDEITICIQHFSEPVEVRMVNEDTNEQLCRAVLEMEEIYYKTPREIGDLMERGIEGYSGLRGLVDGRVNIGESGYFKGGKVLEIRVGENRRDLQIVLESPDEEKNPRFSQYKQQLRHLLRQAQSEHQNQNLKQLLGSMIQQGFY